MLIALLIPLCLGALVYSVMLIRVAVANRIVPKGEAVILGAVTNFFDTLGIGSFAPSMAWFKFRKLVPDRLLPCTMLVGHTLPTITQAVIFLVLLGVLVDPVLLAGCMIALLMGGLLGAPMVVRTKVWVVQLVVGCALILAAGLYTLTNLGMMPGGGTASSLPLTLMIVAIVANFIFGILLNFGIGNYAPTLVMLSLMGMDPRLAFPIMAGGAAMAVAGASARHISMGEIDLRIVSGMAIGGIPAVFVAAFIVKSLPLETLRWMVIVVVLYAAVMMLRSAMQGRREPQSLQEDRAAAI
ncbi:sulfite exporter TauE/SafE family protein [Sphingomonas daechungensis]|uniref:Probable membrane transporter protein n=1 Tax=Sphingomonas daechungensis TaxID=1176646 RepID=A0ABX6T0Z9_9SPHN|nr:sulfite exporter TauE/SafE family protein [Sphingomonas daechungensis]QNP43521.1 sulfite exporter TauE/SafE family protein [Sphingomonas daechungensis]